MAKDGINLPGGYGGLIRYSEEYPSKFIVKPSYVIGFIVLIILFVTFLKMFFPAPLQ
jgi:preprotein translocase subunit Sec61beta